MVIPQPEDSDSRCIERPARVRFSGWIRRGRPGEDPRSLPLYLMVPVLDTSSGADAGRV